jgi:hypothetical protein
MLYEILRISSAVDLTAEHETAEEEPRILAEDAED